MPAPIATPDPDQGKANSEGTGKGQSGKAGEEGPAPEPPAVSPKAEKACSCGCGHDHNALVKAAAKKGLKPIKRNRKTVLKLQAKVQKTVGSFLAAQVRPLAEAILSEASKAQAAGDLQKMSHDEALKILQAVGMDWTALGGDLEPLLSAIAQDGGSAGLAQIGKTTEDLLEQVNERAVAWAEKHAAELVTKVTDVTRDRIAGDVAAAIELGMSVDELADALASTYAFSDQRAELIATTERAFADVAGNRLAYGASGVVGGLEWVTANGGGDERTCEECDLNNGAVVPMDEAGNATEPFPSGATTVPAHPGCLCDLLPVLNEEAGAEKAEAEGFDLKKVEAMIRNAITSQAPPTVNVTLGGPQVNIPPAEVAPITVHVEAAKAESITKMITFQRGPNGELLSATTEEAPCPR